jgi:Family of unknown function (DUF6445)
MVRGVILHRCDDEFAIIELMTFTIGEVVRFAGTDSVVRNVDERDGIRTYLIDNGEARLPMWIPEAILTKHQARERPLLQFHQRSPSVLVVDDFLRDPDEVRSLALAQEYGSDLRYFKGLRTHQRFLWPGLREEFGRLLGRPVTEWLGHGANGIFQQTNMDDPLVWHHDTQGYAAAIYLTRDAPPGTGTSFWRDRRFGCRRRPSHPLESARLGSPQSVSEAESVVYDPYNIEHGDNWELVESVAGLYNRLVIWDASLIHSATSYTEFTEGSAARTRLVQLFFFDAE